jgi:hypothetical protein
VRSTVRLALACCVVAAALLAPAVQAQEPGDLVPTSPLPITGHYLDGDGYGTLTIEEGMQIMIYPLPPGQPIQVSLVQWGVLYHGAGRLYEPDADGNAPLNFTLYSPSGRGYQFQGTLTPSGFAQGTYSPLAAPQRRYSWVLYP